MTDAEKIQRLIEINEKLIRALLVNDRQEQVTLAREANIILQAMK